MTDELTFQPHYSLYQSEIVDSEQSGSALQRLQRQRSGRRRHARRLGRGALPIDIDNNCLTNGEASLALKQAAAQGVVLTSLVGFSLIYNTLDNNKNPTTGLIATYKQDVAGLGGDSRFVRETFDSQLLLSADRRFHRLLAVPGRPDQRLRRRQPLHHRQLQPRADAGARLRAGRHRAARHFRSRQICRRPVSAARPISAAPPKCSFRSSACRKRSA